MAEVWGVDLRDVRKAVREWNKSFVKQINTKLTGEALAQALIDAVEATREKDGDGIFDDLSPEFVQTYNSLLKGGGYLDGGEGEEPTETEEVQQAEPQEPAEPEPAKEEPLKKEKKEKEEKGKAKKKTEKKSGTALTRFRTAARVVVNYLKDRESPVILSEEDLKKIEAEVDKLYGRPNPKETHLQVSRVLVVMEELGWIQRS